MMEPIMIPQILKVLVVDDEPLVLEILKTILESAGHTVVTARNGADAIRRLCLAPETDLIISDMNMPKMNGLELIQKLNQAETDVPIIILTGNNEIRVAVEAMKCGASDYLLKDENIQDTLLISIEKVMKTHRLRQENRKLLADLERKNRELERLSFLDGLTNIANRRYFEKVIHQEWRYAAREGTPLSLIMIDIDFFKAFNDTYGHQQGDVCLIRVARTLNDALKRPRDIVARYGGEEFVAVLPRTNLTGAAAVAEIMRARVSAMGIPHEGSQVSDRITVSLGVSAALPCPRSSPLDLIALSDRALYAAKTDGRDQVRIVRCDRKA